MKREAVAIVAVLAAALSAGAIGYAVVWGLDFDAPAPLASDPQPPIQPALQQDTTKRVDPPVVVMRPQPGEDAPRAAFHGVAAAAPGAAVMPAPAALADRPSDLPPRSIVFAPAARGEDVPPLRIVSRRLFEAAPVAGRPMPMRPELSALLAQPNEPAMQAPRAVPDPPPPLAVAPPAGQGRPVALPPRRPEVVHRDRPPAPSVLVVPPAPLPPPDGLLGLPPPPGVVVTRGVPAHPIDARGVSVMRGGLSAPPRGVVVTRGASSAPFDPPGVSVMRGAPAAPPDAGLARSGPAIIEMPAAKRR
jgi:hypothetical protein